MYNIQNQQAHENSSPPPLHINLPEITNMHLENLQQWTSFCFSQSEYGQWLCGDISPVVLHGEKQGVSLVEGVGPKHSSLGGIVVEWRGV